MPSPTPCVPCCSTPQSVNIPGGQGNPGVDGANGVNAFAILQAGIVAAGVGTGQTMIVDTSQWMVIGQVIVVDGPVHLRVTATPTVTMVQATELGYAGDIMGAIAAGAKIGPAGVGSSPMLSGTATLVAGTATVTAAITAASIIQATRSAMNASTKLGVLEVPTASRNVGAGTFVINALNAATPAVETNDLSDVDWLVIG